jgi:pimeloyl-ACP methyl ester carboxylesterase
MTLLERLQAMPTQGVALPFRGFIRYRESWPQETTDQAPLILLHGIGSGSGSWLHQLGDTRLGRVLAWDAPGYADSSALKMQEPAAADYAQVLWAWLDALAIQDVHLVGHSLGCIMAAAAARLQPQRVKALTLLAPAQGYGPAPEAVRIKKRDERLQAMAQLGLQKMAEQRAPRLLSADAHAEQIELATHMMSRLTEGGYTQATCMLSIADIRADLQAFKQHSTAPIQVACGDQDVITPPAACQDLAQSIQAPYTDLPGAGHLCALQVPQAIAPILSQGLSHD